MSAARIEAISYVLPENTLTNEDLVEKFPEWSVEKVANKVGIKKRHITSSDEFSSDLAVKAAEKLFEEHKIERKSIDFILLCTQSPDYALPTTACIVQDKLDLSTTCGALDFNLGCSGYVYGLALAKGLIESSISKNVLLITSETYSKYLDENDKSNRTIFGDGASATLISTQGDIKIGEFELGTDGSGAENLIVKNSGAKNNRSDSNKLFMNGAEIFNFTLNAVPKLIDSVIEKNNLKKETIHLYIFHQANKFMLNHLRRKMDISEGLFFLYMEAVGNTVSSTIPIALYHALDEHKIKPGSNVLIAGFGVGYSWGGTVLKFQND